MMLIKVPNRNIIINPDEVTHIYIKEGASDKAEIVFDFKNGKTLFCTCYTQRKPYKQAFNIAQEVMDELTKVIEKLEEEPND